MIKKAFYSRKITRGMSYDHPIGDPTGGPAYGERNEPVSAAFIALSAATTTAATIAAVATIVSYVGIGLTIVGAVTGNKGMMKIGSIMGLAGGVAGMAAGAGSGAASTAAESAFSASGGVAAGNAAAGVVGDVTTAAGIGALDAAAGAGASAIGTPADFNYAPSGGVESIGTNAQPGLLSQPAAPPAPAITDVTASPGMPGATAEAPVIPSPTSAASTAPTASGATVATTPGAGAAVATKPGEFSFGGLLSKVADNKALGTGLQVIGPMLSGSSQASIAQQMAKDKAEIEAAQLAERNRLASAAGRILV